MDQIPELFRDLIASAISNALASAVLNPSDVVKIRLQTSINSATIDKPAIYRTPRQTVFKIIKEEGIFARWGGLYLPGIKASILRELSYGCIRFSLYTPAKHLFMGKDEKDPGLGVKILSGGMSGSIGSLIATPTDVVKIRFQKEAGLVKNGVYTTGLHQGHPPTYRSTLSAFGDIYRAGGIRGLYRGWQPTVGRACVLAAAQLSTYDHVKFMMKRDNILEEGPKLHVAASLIAAVSATVVTQPFDTVKTILITNHFKGPLETLVFIVRNNGPLFLYRGAFPSFCRFAPHFIIALPLWEEIRYILGLKPV